MKQARYKASVKVMNSYDYSHFETSLASDKTMTIQEINGMRKVSQRLVYEAIRQYKKAKDMGYQATQRKSELCILETEVKRIKEIPKNEWTASDKAKVKLIADKDWASQFDYDYDYDDDDDWED